MREVGIKEVLSGIVRLYYGVFRKRARGLVDAPAQIDELSVDSIVVDRVNAFALSGGVVIDVPGYLWVVEDH